jgi:hypothetical protein
METVAIMLGVIVLGVIGIAWDYYKPSRFRTGYHTVRKNSADGLGVSSLGISSNDIGYSGGGDFVDNNNDGSCGDGGD